MDGIKSNCFEKMKQKYCREKIFPYGIDFDYFLLFVIALNNKHKIYRREQPNGRSRRCLVIDK